MALFLFTKAILAGEPIKVFNHDQHKRSFTYIDDIVEGVISTLDKVPIANLTSNSDAPDPATGNVPYRIFNIGNESTVELMRYIRVLGHCLEKKAKMEMQPLQAEDVPDTEADVSELIRAVDHRPTASVEEGVRNFVRGYGEYYGVETT